MAHCKAGKPPSVVMRRLTTVMIATGLGLGLALGAPGLAVPKPTAPNPVGPGGFEEPECYNAGGYVDYIPYTNTYFCGGTSGGGALANTGIGGS